MTIVSVQTSTGSYPIHIAPGRLSSLAHTIPADATALALITNTTINALLGDRVARQLEKTGKRLIRIVLPDGEAHKNWQTLNQIFDTLLRERLDRKAVLVALGGGVIGDIAGFAAASYLRGVRFVQVPTTLLAQVDSSVGGKTGINHPLGKNMIGAFYPPIAVEIDTDVLQSLPDREISAGLAEVIKYGAILDADFFAWCEANASALRLRDAQALQTAIARSCEVKAWVVERDERESSGLRALLNFGHTFGHAIEAGLGYGTWLHGEAVGCGMVQAASLSARVTGLSRADVARIRDLVAAIGCPIVPPDLGTQAWIDWMLGDKKTQGGEIRFVLLSAIGQAESRPVPDAALQQVLAQAASPRAPAATPAARASD